MKKIILLVPIIALIIIAVLIIKAVSTTAAIVNGLLGTILAIAIIISLLLIVGWMFSYARRHK